MPFRNVNVGTDDLPHVYDVSIPAGIVPTPLSTSYLSFKNFQLDLLDKKFPWRTFVPYAATNSAIESQVVMLRSPKIQSYEPDVFHYGHSLYFTRVNAAPAQTAARLIIRAKVGLYTFQGFVATLPTLKPTNLYTEFTDKHSPL